MTLNKVSLCCDSDSLQDLKNRYAEVKRANMFIASTFAKVKLWAPHQYESHFRRCLDVMSKCELSLEKAIKEKEDEKDNNSYSELDTA